MNMSYSNLTNFSLDEEMPIELGLLIGFCRHQYHFIQEICPASELMHGFCYSPEMLLQTCHSQFAFNSYN